jgi:hypothetical protein
MSDEDSSGWQLTESDPGVFTYVEMMITDLPDSRNRTQGVTEEARGALHCR